MYNPPPRANSAEEYEAQQIRIGIPGVQETEFQRRFVIFMEDNIHRLEIYLPPTFPKQDVPRLTVVPPANRPMLDSQGNVNIPNWAGLTIVRVANDIIKTFKPGYQPPAPVAPPQQRLPPSKFAIDNLSKEELENLLNDEAKFLEFCLTLHQIKHQTSVLQEMKENNEQLAKSNIEKEQTIEHARAQLIASHEELKLGRESYENVYAQVRSIIGDNDPEHVLERLHDAVEEQDDKTEKITNSFISGEIDVKDFIKNFKDERMIYHLRAAKYERLKERLDSGH